MLNISKIMSVKSLPFHLILHTFIVQYSTLQKTLYINRIISSLIAWLVSQIFRKYWTALSYSTSIFHAHSCLIKFCKKNVKSFRMMMIWVCWCLLISSRKIILQKTQRNGNILYWPQREWYTHTMAGTSPAQTMTVSWSFLCLVCACGLLPSAAVRKNTYGYIISVNHAEDCTRKRNINGGRWLVWAKEY